MNTRIFAKQAVKQHIIASALARFSKQSYEITTVDEIAADVGMSTRTFFRYFPSKEDVLLEPTRRFSAEFLHTLHQHVSAADLWLSLEMTLIASARAWSTMGDSVTSIQEIIGRTPALVARQLEISERLQVDVTDLCMAGSAEAAALGWGTSHAVVRSAFACLRATHYQFSGEIHGERALEELRRLLGALRPVLLLSH